VLCNVESQPAQHRVYLVAGKVGHHHEHVAFPGPETPDQGLEFRLAEEPHDVGLKPPFRVFHPGHALSAEGRDDLHGVLVLEQVLAHAVRRPGDTEPLDAAPFARNAPENGVGRAGDDVRDVLEFEGEPEVGTVRAIAFHGLIVGHAGEGALQGDSAHLEDPDRDLLHQVMDELLVHEGSFQV